MLLVYDLTNSSISPTHTNVLQYVQVQCYGRVGDTLLDVAIDNDIDLEGVPTLAVPYACVRLALLSLSPSYLYLSHVSLSIFGTLSYRVLMTDMNRVGSDV